ncbi:MAG TPA: TolC family protein [Saprospiraceae bacterium]|nr:TolC family protein [Saprospiraceae bacterium]
MLLIKRIYMVFGVLICTILHVHSQNIDSPAIALSYPKGKEILINESLKSLSAYYNINLAEAELQQTKLWNNPTFVWNADMYNLQKNNYFNFNQQKLIQIEYIFNVSGKRIQAIRLAKLGIDIAKLAYADVVRGMVLEYSNAYAKLINLSTKAKIYDNAISKYGTLIQSYQKQLELGMVSENDLIRLNSEFTMLKSDATNISMEINEIHGELNSMLNFAKGTIILPTTTVQLDLNEISYEVAMQAAIDNRPDFHIAQKHIGYHKQDLKVQKANRIPDIKLGYQPHDTGSNYVRPYSGMVFEMGIPLFNRNQGEISKSKIRIEQSKLDVDYTKNQISNDINSSLFNYKTSKVNLQRYSDDLIGQVEKLINDANISFDKKNISLLQYMDYHQNFIDVKLQYSDALYQYQNAVNELNFTVGKEITN